MIETSTEETRSRIIQTAHDLFMQLGIKSVSMDDISSQLGVSKKTLYKHFPDKESIVVEVVKSVLNKSRNICESGIQQSHNALHELILSVEHMYELFRHMNPSVLFDLYKYYPKAYASFDKYKNQDLLGVIKLNLKRGIQEEVFRSEIPVDIISKYRLESIVMPFSPEFQKNSKARIFDVSKALTEHYLHGIVTSKGLKLMSKHAKILYSK